MYRYATRLLAAVSIAFALIVAFAAPAAAQVPIGIYNVADGAWQYATVHLVTEKDEAFVGEVWIAPKGDAMAWTLPAAVPVAAIDGKLVLRAAGLDTPSPKATFIGLDSATSIDRALVAERVHLAIDGETGTVSGALRLVPGRCAATCTIERLDWFAIDRQLLPAAVAQGEVAMPAAAAFPIEAGDLLVTDAR